MLFKNLKELNERKENLRSEIESMELLIASKQSYLSFLDKNPEASLFFSDSCDGSDGGEDGFYCKMYSLSSLRGIIQPGLNVINDKISKIDERVKYIEDSLGAIYPHRFLGEKKK